MKTLQRNKCLRSFVQATMDEELDAVAAADPALCEVAHRARVTLRDAVGNASGQPRDHRWVAAHTAIRALLDRVDALADTAARFSLTRLRAFVAENNDLEKAV